MDRAGPTGGSGPVLTACGGEDAGTKSAGPADSSAPTAESSQSAQSGGTAQSGGAVADTAAAKGSGNAKGGAAKGSTGTSSSSAATCTTKDVTISAAYQGGPPYTHIVLTAKNTSGHSCRLNGFPEIQFLESHKENVPAVAKSKPPTPVVLTAGAPAYALVKLSDGGADEDNEPVTAFSVTLTGGGGMATVKAPGSQGIAVDPAKWATGYWTYELRNGADDF
ncbi:DUF4232 domain-containing protein [Streptomyces sp. NPDC048411]|uniref:DUF4232 domain-containing protein n=1 Tax=Streptomyces sp. NPDC048411 TaxID=3157206 RepID=UPI0034529067